MDDLQALGVDPTKAEHGPDRLITVKVIGAAGDHDGPLLRRLLLPMHPADVAELLQNAPKETARTIFTLIGEDLDAEVYAELEDELREFALEFIPASKLAQKLDDLDTDDAAAIVAELDDEDRAEVLAAASDDVRVAVEGALSFEEETAGRLMQREFVAAPQHWDVGQTIDFMRKTGEDLPDLFFDIYVVSPAMQPIGAIPVSKLMRAKRTMLLQDLMETPEIIVDPETDQEVVAHAFQKYHLISAPVVDRSGRLTGMITVDDIVRVIQDENEEDLLALAGVRDASTADSVWSSVKSRLPWLVINLVTALIASVLISKFQASIEKIVALAVMMPMVASMGGNAGTQTVAVAVRALAARELTPGNSGRIILREVITGLVNGAVFAVLLSSVALFWFQSVLLSVTIALAILLNLSVAGLAGILIPLTLKRLGQDPAVSSGVLVTFVTDMVGFVAFLGLATLIIL
ncbi:MAG: magnesium transporter [Hyphomonadaceae bacterium]|jgi:magnesium transporter|uniref:magnesium transporter n=1 Tax=Aquidulcibacter sp. TaxID=2052990 RepID=UPI0022CD135C|nr:magnesium transporter [Aquidulcibacter sp.]MCE2890233.1 magnesium transporter [Hyphomonadaceae bacterium]MCZ8207166.1 magnesium transporter [Aquidulcibacter sp.]